MIVLFLFLMPLIGASLSFIIRNDRSVRTWALLVSLATLALAIWGCTTSLPARLQFHTAWMGSLNSSFSLQLDGLSKILCLLTAVSYPIILLATWNTSYKRPHTFFALMQLTQAGLLGVFTSTDALLFYFFWELALVPVYFLCSTWGGEKRIQVTFKFFIYTFTGSVLMLVGLIYLYSQTADHSFAIESFYKLKLTNGTQSWLFWLLMMAFIVKMPLWPFHTWQPDTYEQSPTAVTMVLSGIMVKMGVYGIIRWVIPVVPNAAYEWGDVISTLSVIGVIYASVIAIRQNDMKRLIAYSSIAHMGIMGVTLFSETYIGWQGVMMQMFNHGINIIGLWIVVEVIERQFGTRKFSDLGGLATKAPVLTLLLVIIAFANISLPLTNAFVGEFMMFAGIFTSAITKYSFLFTVLAALSIILGAVYTLNMIQKAFFGQPSAITEKGLDIRATERIALSLIVVMILVFGVYPQPLLHLTDSIVKFILNRADVSAAHLFAK